MRHYLVKDDENWKRVIVSKIAEGLIVTRLFPVVLNLSFYLAVDGFPP